MNWYFVQDGKVVLRCAGDVPDSFKHPAKGAISGMKGLTNEERALFDWYPGTEPGAEPTIDPRTQKKTIVPTVRPYSKGVAAGVDEAWTVDALTQVELNQLLAQDLDLALARVLELREENIAKGFAAGDHRWDSDQRSRENLSATVAAVAAGMPLPASFAWRSEDNQNVPMDAAALVGLGAAMLQHVNACYVRSWELKAALAAAKDPDDVDLEAGWPK